MGNTIRNAQNAIMNGSSRYRKWREEFEKDWVQPEMELEIAKLWHDLPPAMKLWYKDNKPEVFKEMDRKYGGK